MPGVHLHVKGADTVRRLAAFNEQAQPIPVRKNDEIVAGEILKIAAIDVPDHTQLDDSSFPLRAPFPII